MRVKDFEVAVDALNCSIKLDEVRINKDGVMPIDCYVRDAEYDLKFE